MRCGTVAADYMLLRHEQPWHESFGWPTETKGSELGCRRWKQRGSRLVLMIRYVTLKDSDKKLDRKTKEV